MKQDRLLCTAALRLNVPPTYEYYMEWGFFDGSVRFYAADTRKVCIFPCVKDYIDSDSTSSWDTLSTSTLASSPTPVSQIHAHLLPVAPTVLFHYGQLLQRPSRLICSPWVHSLVIEHRSPCLPSHVPSVPCYLRRLTDRSCYGISIGDALCEHCPPMVRLMYVSCPQYRLHSHLYTDELAVCPNQRCLWRHHGLSW
jgi:hypothetical protein